MQGTLDGRHPALRGWSNDVAVSWSALACLVRES
jgi:hypothetical protein